MRDEEAPYTENLFTFNGANAPYCSVGNDSMQLINSKMMINNFIIDDENVFKSLLKQGNNDMFSVSNPFLAKGNQSHRKNAASC